LLGKQRGFNQWNVVGSSYGTRVAQTYLRDFPNSVRAMSLDGPSPLDSSIDGTIAVGGLDAANTVVALCTGQPACVTLFPALKASFSDALIRLSAKPIEVEGVKIGVSEVLSIVAGAATSADDLKGVPLFMDRISAGDINGAFTAFSTPLTLENFAPSRPFNPIPFGANFAIRCKDELGLPEQQGALSSVAKDWSTAVGRAALAASSFTIDQALCGLWTNDVVPLDFKNRIVNSAIPVLITVGQFDATTPKSLAALLSTRLAKSQTVIVANAGHALLESDDACAFALHGAFIDAPEKLLNTQCAVGAAVPMFVGKSK
jgi:pimeloyl-ACP methyl ester carboxylesterase